MRKRRAKEKAKKLAQAESGKQSDNESGKQPDNESTNESGKQSDNESGKQPDNESGKQPDNESGKQPDNESHKQVENEEVKVKTESGKRGRPKGKGKSIRLPMSPESFADFSVSVDNLALGITSKDSLRDYEKQSIKLAAVEMAKVMDIPIAMVYANYGITMVMPHVSRYVDKQNEKADWEIKKIKEELKAKGIEIDEKELKFGNRDKIKQRIEKELELSKMKQNINKTVGDNEDDIIL